uniref:cAMP responsive element binding protein 5a n=1 Tax=Sinocyclocheilus anshuiensis TaxID=1608454 RepID=A0A671MAX9_9TELE
MNVDQDRPYVCTAPGCSQRFQREDHLIIHRHKHEMTLTFPSIKCDSMLSGKGILCVLKNVKVPSNLTITNNPHAQETLDVEIKNTWLPVKVGKANLASGSSLLKSMNYPQCYMTLMLTVTPGAILTHLSPSVILQRSKVIPAHSQPAVSNGSQNPLCHMMEMMSSHQHPLSHLQSASHHHAYQQHCHSQSPQRLVHQHQSQDQSHHSHAHHSPPAHLHPGSTHQTTPPLSHQTIPTQMSSTPKQTPCPQSPPQLSTGRRRRTSEEGPDERREKFLERNRAAATRCRQKRKVWVMSLERKAEELTHTNLQLQNEVTSLRTEVSQLKQILLSHKDCPVSVRQRETQSKYESFSHSLLLSHKY